MAFGQKQTYVAFPQPGTTNLPYGITIPGGKGGAATYIPPFVPVVVTSTDNAAEIIAAASAAMVLDIKAVALAIVGTPGIPGTFSTIEAQLNAINIQLARIADNITALSNLLHELSVYVQAAGVIVNSKNVSNAVETGHTVKFNNYTTVISDATPVMPPLKEQLTQIVKDAQDMTTIARTSTLISGAINDVVSSIANWAKDTSGYKTVANWVKTITSTFTIPAIPSLETIANKLKSFLGIKGP
jgi:hypothetical protein